MIKKDMLDFALKVESIAKIGLVFSKDPYALDNYAELEKLAKIFIEEFANIKIERDNYFARDIYPTPNISVRAVVIKDNQLLLVQEKNTGLYSLPGGWADLYDSPSEAIIREAQEEAGAKLINLKVIGVLDRLIGNKEHRTPEYVLAFKADVEGPLEKPCYEISNCAYFDLNNLPPLSKKLEKIQFDRLIKAAVEDKLVFD